jgi:hypothetical protein
MKPEKKPAIGIVLGAPEEGDDAGDESDVDAALSDAGDAAREAWDKKDMPAFFRAMRAGMDALGEENGEDEEGEKSSPGIADVMGR